MTGGGPQKDQLARRLVVLYDRDCAFCSWTARQLWGFDRHGRLEFLSLQAAATAGRPALARVVGERPVRDALHVVDEASGDVLAGGAAMLAILDELPGGRWFRAWVALPFIPPIVDAGYRLVAGNRDRIGRWLGLDAASCAVPTGRRSRPTARRAA